MPLVAGPLRNGWCAVFCKYAVAMDLAFSANPPQLSRLPPKCRVVICVILEHAIVSYACLWQSGQFIWQIKHESSKGVNNLEYSGRLPKEFEHIKNLAQQEQRKNSNTDYMINVALDAASTITCFRHDWASDEDFDFNKMESFQVPDTSRIESFSSPTKWWPIAASDK
jgi:hypothetical protein